MAPKQIDTNRTQRPGEFPEAAGSALPAGSEVQIIYDESLPKAETAILIRSALLQLWNGSLLP